ncbi:hypothetical protein ACUIAJ_03885 [Dermabacteraceae bacterium CCM 9519]
MSIEVAEIPALLAGHRLPEGAVNHVRELITAYGIEEVQGNVELELTGPRIRQLYTVGPTTIGGAEAFEKDTAIVVRRTTANKFEVAVVGEPGGWRDFGAAPEVGTGLPADALGTLRAVKWDPNAKSEYSWRVPLGPALPSRTVIVSVMGRGVGTSSSNSVTVGGVPLAEVSSAGGNLSRYGTGLSSGSFNTVYYGTVPEGTEAEVKITRAGEAFRAGIAVWTIPIAARPIEGEAAAATNGTTTVGSLAVKGQYTTGAALIAGSPTQPNPAVDRSEGYIYAWQVSGKAHAQQFSKTTGNDWINWVTWEVEGA